MSTIRKPESLLTITIDHERLGRLTLRPLRPCDSALFGQFLDGLGEHTRNMFGPHPLDSAEAGKICDSLNQSDDIRLILVDEDSASDGEIIGYFIIYLRVRPSEIERYAEIGIELSDETDCTFAPCLADAVQGMGIGALVMDHIVDIVRSLGFRRMVLSGGTQSLNRAGRAFYLKVGFREVREFVTRHKTRGRIDNIDMMLEIPGEEPA